MEKKADSNGESKSVLTNGIIEKLSDSSLTFEEILDHNPDRCYIVLLAKIIDINNQNMVIKIKKKEFSTEINLSEMKTNLSKLINNPLQIFHNDIYYKLVCSDLLENKLKVDIVYPADSKVIDKYRKKGYVLIKETQKIYYEKTLKFIENIDASHTKWIDNVLYNNTEKILHNEEGKYIITQDYNSKDNASILNCLGIPFNNTIRSLRDLNASHLDLLESFLKGREKIADIFKVNIGSIRCFIHYPPSFYYFHVHYLHTDYESNSTAVNRAWDLNSIIENIKMKNDYYQSVSLEINVQVGSKLHSILSDA